MNTHQESNAIWQFDREVETDIKTTGSVSNIYTFIYKNSSLTINLPSTSSIVGIPEDDIYRIKTKWKVNDLYIFPPFGNKWELFATWDENRFVMYGDGKVRIFKKIKPEEIAVWQKDLLKSGRKIWNYRYLNPDEVEL